MIGRSRIVLGVGVAFLFCTSLAGAAVQYRVTDLGDLGRGSSIARGINNSGQIVGDSDGVAFLYTNGRMTDIGAGPGTSIAYAINAAGQVVGTRAGKAFVYDGSTIRNLPPLVSSDYASDAFAINDAGQIVGSSGANAWYGAVVPHAFVYFPETATDTATVIDIGTLPGSSMSVAYAINNRGQVVGGSGSSNIYGQAFLYDAGTGSLSPLGIEGSSRALAINESGQVAGQLLDTSPQNWGEPRAFFYDGANTVNLNTLASWGGYGSASSINESGQVVGYIGDAAFLYDDGEVHRLSDLVAPGSGWRFANATGINDLGQIVGYGTNPEGQLHGFLLTSSSVPEPSSMVTFAVLLGIGILGRRRQTSNRVAEDA